MKFTQTDAAKKISSILTRGGKDPQLSDRTIAENIDSLMKALVNDETELDDFIKIAEPMFKTWQANLKKDNSDFIQRWNEEHPTENPSEKPENKGAADTTETKSLLDRISALENELKENAKRLSMDSKRKELVNKCKEKGINDDDWLNALVAEVNITDDLDVEAKADAWLTLYNGSKATQGVALPPENPRGGSDRKQTSNVIAAAASLAKSRKAAGIVQTD